MNITAKLNFLPRVKIGRLDVALWVDLGWVQFYGHGVQWKHERYAMPDLLKPLYRKRVGLMIFSAIRNSTVYAVILPQLL